eukprot:COSAG05_NODE_1164_length_5652_cov_6.810733_4_plen_100_part_00
MVHVHDLPRAKGCGSRDGAVVLCANKRRLQPAKLKGSDVGSKGVRISAFFAPDPEHHKITRACPGRAKGRWTPALPRPSPPAMRLSPRQNKWLQQWRPY